MPGKTGQTMRTPKVVKLDTRGMDGTMPGLGNKKTFLSPDGLGRRRLDGTLPGLGKTTFLSPDALGRLRCQAAIVGARRRPKCRAAVVVGQQGTPTTASWSSQ